MKVKKLKMVYKLVYKLWETIVPEPSYVSSLLKNAFCF